MKRLTASLLAATLVLTSPGLSAWAAFAEARPAAPSPVLPVFRPLHAPATRLIPRLGFLAPAVPAPGSASVPLERAREGGVVLFDQGRSPRAQAESSPVEPPAGSFGGGEGRLSPPDLPGRSSFLPPSPPQGGGFRGPPDRPRGSRFGDLALFALRAAVGAAATLGLHSAAARLAPAVFGASPFAAVWAASHGLVLGGFLLTARWMLAGRNSKGVSRVKWVFDLAVGAYVAGLVIAWPSFGAVIASQGPALAAAAGAVGLGAALARLGGAPMGFLAGLFGVNILPKVVGLAGGASLGVGPWLAMAGLAAGMAVVSSLRAVADTESGRRFSLANSLRGEHLAYSYVMMGVVFALASGLVPPSSKVVNLIFPLWMFLGNRLPGPWQKGGKLGRNLFSKFGTFNVFYIGLAAVAALKGFHGPTAFLVVAFSVERAGHWAHRLMARLMAGNEKSAVPSAIHPADAAPSRPVSHHWRNTILLTLLMGGIGLALGPWVYGLMSLFWSTLTALALVAIPFIFGTRIIKAMMKAEPTDENKDPEIFQILNDLRQRIPAKWGRGMKMPEVVRVPLPVPNAFATGPTPDRALVGVTEPIKQMLLEPHNLCDSIVRLMGAVDAEDPAFKVFRRAIARSIPEVNEQMPPNQVAQAVLRARDSERMRDLGRRLMRGVLAHELSHVMDRHMLSGSIAGLISSAVAFASYGMLWTLGHAKRVALAGVQRLAARASHRPPGNGSNPGGGKAPPDQLTSAAPEASYPEVFEPVSAGLLAGKLPTLIRAFLGQWVPLAFQVLQMAGSRNNESQADWDGAELSGDPEALALALGLLMSWQPTQPKSFLFDVLRLPARLRLVPIALPHLFTVSPLGQLDRAGALSRLGPAKGWLSERKEGFFQDLFTTHPDTVDRIRRLWSLSGGERPPPAPGGPPQASFTPGSTGTGGGFFRVLSDPGRNREFWKFTWTQALLTLGVTFHYSALPKLAAPSKEQTQRLGWARAGNWGAQAAANFATGPWLDEVSTEKVLVWTHRARAYLMLALPALFFLHALSFGALLAVLVAAGFLQSMSGTAGQVAFTRILGGETARYNRANAVFTVITSAVGVAGPLAAGTFIGLMDGRYGALAGNALSYGVYGVALLAAVAFFKRLKLPAETAPATPCRRGAWKDMREGLRLISKSRLLLVSTVFSTPALLIGDSLVFASLTRFIQDVLKPQAALALGPRLPILGAVIRGLTSKSGAFGLYLAATSLGVGLSTMAMIFLPDRAASRLENVVSAFSRRLPETWDAPRKEAVAEAVRRAAWGELERYRAALEADTEKVPDAARARTALFSSVRDALGTAAPGQAPRWSSRLMSETGLDLDLAAWARREFGRSLPLERQGWWSSFLNALGWVALWGVFGSGGLWSSVGFMFVSTLLEGPALNVWWSLTQSEVKRRFPADKAKVFSSIFLYQLLYSVAGLLLFSSMLSVLPTPTVLRLTVGLALATAALNVVLPFVALPRRRRGGGRAV